MFVKRLELCGFKSFVEKTKLEFEAGVTAIVGPNGCGKSNISDALKWVLGEQSALSMRGTKMEDVIFHGAEGIPPVGFAEVSLTISNQQKLLPLDYEEVTITRRIFRSGESEYLINKIPVRLKDINDLLMGTGMGMHSYSIMEQGKVDQILSARAQDRRDIFEEASGITKYKSRKEEALRKLERTGENLLRLQDIIVEVKRQIKSIERQVSKARRYKEEFAQLKQHELRVAEYEYRNLRSEKDKLAAGSTNIEKEESGLAAQMDQDAQSLSEVKQNLSSLEEKISRLQAESYELTATIQTANNKVSLDQERIEELTRRAASLNQESEQLKEKIAATSQSIQEAEEQVEANIQEKEEKTNLLSEREENITQFLDAVQQAQKTISNQKNAELEVIAQQTKLKNDNMKLQTNLANINARLRRLNVEKERTEQELNDLDDKSNVCTEELKALHQQLQQLTRENWDFKSNLSIKTDKSAKFAARLEEVVHQLAALESKLEFLKELSKKYEGFSQGVKSILSGIESQTIKIHGICGVVANLVEVATGYQIAMEMALGEQAQAIVVENNQSAEAAINYLQLKDAGRACFLSLENLARYRRREIKLKGSLGRAAQLVTVAPKYQQLIEFLLRNSFIAQDRQTAQQIIQKTDDPNVKIVTLQGEIITKAGIVSGSLPKSAQASLLGRRKKMLQLQAQVEKIKQEKNELEDLKTGLESEINQLRTQIEEQEPALNKLKIKLANKESEQSNIETSRKRFADEISVLTVEITEADEQQQQLQAEQNQLNQQLDSIDQQQKQIQEKIQSCQDLIAEQDQKRQEALVEITKLKTEIAGLDREKQASEAKLQMIRASEQEQKGNQQLKGQEAQETLAKVEELKQESQQLQSQSQELTQTKASLEQTLNQALQERQSLSQVIRNLEKQARENQVRLDLVRQRRSKLQVSLTELSYKQDALKERMLQSYQVDLSASPENLSQAVGPAEPGLVEEINRLKAKLQGLGPVNLVAIDENEQLQQRYSFLITQQQDLIKAQESLRRAITQINQTARKLFAQTFEKIQLNFKEYFRILFGGGDARIILLEENNILESGIEIVVRPPGKKLQNISLLSGGEKALTAIALLFAIFKVKPSPFCILDEVDAALDEANIGRFVNLFAEFIKTSQFIVITHSKKTINMADIMYGITMEKSGISKIVSVKFTDNQEAAQEEVAQVG